jgi:hypothetical protein
VLLLVWDSFLKHLTRNGAHFLRHLPVPAILDAAIF